MATHLQKALQDLSDAEVMRSHLLNPFEVTKAIDFSDQQIKDYWVDIYGDSGFSEMLKPTSPMPMIVLGGKGSGKTHLMRYFSFNLQRLRHEGEVVAGLKEEGYLGVYLLGSSLNAKRFKGKDTEEDVWYGLFSHYLDLLLAQLLLNAVVEAYQEGAELRDHEEILCRDVLALFTHHSHDGREPAFLCDLIDYLGKRKRLLDKAVNNLSLGGDLDGVEIISSPGELILGLPDILKTRLPSLEAVRIMYLIDEFENLEEYQQIYINTLIRERRPSSSIKLGAKLYGMKTYKTYSGEINREGSEHETLHIDDRLRKSKSRYKRFAYKLFLRRLRESGYISVDVENALMKQRSTAERYYQTQPITKLCEEETRFVIEKYGDQERPYFKNLRSELEKHTRRLPYPFTQHIDEIVKNLQCPEYPLLEKTNIFLFYSDWSRDSDLLTSSRKIAEECSLYIEQGFKEGRHDVKLKHFKGDLLAQLLRDCHKPQLYIGLDTFIDMSDGLPRNLLVLLKSIYEWSLFNGERPFRDEPISIKSQQKGLLEATEWFYRDAKPPGPNGEDVQEGIGILAEFFRAVRFSHKPSECSLCAFSVDRSRVSKQARDNLDLAENWSLLISIQGGQHDRNSERVDAKYQLSRMLAPRWDLPISRRGVIPLSPQEVTAIFDPAHRHEAKDALAARLSRMNVPFEIPRPTGSKNQLNLPGLFDD